VTAAPSHQPVIGGVGRDGLAATRGSGKVRIA